MSKNTNDVIELPKTPSVKRVTDEHGKGWLCSGGAKGVRDLAGQGCQREEDVIYDRGFGG